jgi:hypothetical protein
MGKYLDILARNTAERATRVEQPQTYDINDINDKRPLDSCVSGNQDNRTDTLSRLSRLCRTLDALESRCPDLIEPSRWHLAIEDGRRFLADWGSQAEALGWTARDLFGLHEVPANPHPTYQRLSRYDCTGLIWLLQGCPVLALAEETAAIKMPTGSVTTYRRHNKPAYGPLGDSFDDFVA